MPREYLERVLRARVYDVAKETPLTEAVRLSNRLQNRVLLKREDLQTVFSFKLRGAYNKIISLDEVERAKGVITASAGNHAQGVALAAQRLDVKALIVMPETTPLIKIEAVRAFGAAIIAFGSTFDEAREHAEVLAREKGMVYVHPYDDPLVIAGQGTVADEILRQHGPDIDVIFVPVGGGGLIAGMSAFIKSLWPHIRIVGVEPVDAASMHDALAAGERVKLDHVGIFVDGVAVRQVGEETFRIARKCVDEIILVSTDEICAAIKDIFEDTRSITEPAGALATAGLKRYVAREGVKNQTLIAIASGANVNFDRLRYVAERAQIGEHREGLLAVTIPERPGALRQFCDLIGDRAITEFNYRFADSQEAHIFVGIALNDEPPDSDGIIGILSDNGYPALDMTDNEMAKIHVRYMVGGRANGGGNEVLYRFDFPERPGALLRFLTHMGERWNMSLFHYRNHGGAFGRVLIGLQVPSDETNRLQDFLVELGYHYVEETQNPAYQLFLR
ncbi:MAG: threonine dehydratase [Myxococcota bacterium]|jgi:threonine dehydratase